MTTQTGLKTFQELVQAAKTEIQEISLAELQQRLNDHSPFILIDVREGEDFNNGSIPGAVHLSRGMLELDIDELAPTGDETLILYCGGGSRSALAAKTLQDMGYRNVFSLQGGYKAWRSQP